MATITPTPVRGAGAPGTLAVTVLTASDTLVYKPTQSQVLILRNDTGASKTVNIDGANATTISPTGYGGTISVAGGKDIVIADGASAFVRLSDIKAFLAGIIAITGGTGVEAMLIEQ